MLSLRKKDINDAAKDLTADATMQDCRHVASYCWLDKKGLEAAILVLA